jgi:hypothetical protein
MFILSLLNYRSSNLTVSRPADSQLRNITGTFCHIYTFYLISFQSNFEKNVSRKKIIYKCCHLTSPVITGQMTA